MHRKLKQVLKLNSEQSFVYSSRKLFVEDMCLDSGLRLTEFKVIQYIHVSLVRIIIGALTLGPAWCPHLGETAEKSSK